MLAKEKSVFSSLADFRSAHRGAAFQRKINKNAKKKNDQNIQMKIAKKFAFAVIIKLCSENRVKFL